MNPQTEEIQGPSQTEEYKVVYISHGDIEPIIISVEEAKEVIESLREKLNPQELWINNFNALDELRKLFKGSYGIIVPYLTGTILVQLKAALLNLRSNVAKNALLMVQTLYLEPRSEELIPFTRQILPLLLGRLSSAKHFIQLEIKKSIESITRNLVSLDTPFIIHQSHLNSKAALAPSVIDFVASLLSLSFRGFETHLPSFTLQQLPLQKLCPLFHKYWEGRSAQKKAMNQIFQILSKKFTKEKVEEVINGLEGVEERAKDSIKRGLDTLSKKKEGRKKIDLKEHIRNKMLQRKKQSEQEEIEKDKVKIKEDT